MTTTTTTTTTTPPTLADIETWATIETALRQRRPLNLSYHGRQRLISPHALGIKNNRAMLLAYQTNNPTNPADPQWRCMYLDQIDHITLAHPTHQWQTADTYNPDHPFPNIDHLTIAITPTPPPS
jgi:predicted DNA-binding transcriptional regulator YafY